MGDTEENIYLTAWFLSICFGRLCKLRSCHMFRLKHRSDWRVTSVRFRQACSLNMQFLYGLNYG